MTEDRTKRRRLLRMPWMPWLIRQGRQVPGPDTPRDNPKPEPKGEQP
jgi:hypothetical protein